jgi:hypothetical protein
MKMGKKLLAAMLLLTAFLFNEQLAMAQKSDSAQEASVKKLVDSKDYVFYVESATPMSGRLRFLTPGNTVHIAKDSVECDLPYFGRVYTSSVNTTDGGIKFISTSFDYTPEVRKKGGIPVVVTPANRRSFGEDGKITNSLADYPEAARQIAKQENVALIDLNAMTKIFYEALGPDKSKKAFVIYPANTWPGQTKDFNDNTHFNGYGAYELAKCIIEGMRENKLDITKYLVDDLPIFDPAHPDLVESFSLPISPKSSVVKPDGN